MKENYKDISLAKDYDSAIEIIPERLCSFGLRAMEMELVRDVGVRTKDVVMVPILKGGSRVGKELSSFAGLHVTLMQMSYYSDENTRRDAPICIIKPDIEQIVVGDLTRDVYFAEGVVESETTVKEAINAINSLIDEKSARDNKQYSYPKYHTYALVSKVKGTPEIPNFVYPLWVSPDIWVHGWGVDNSQKGREMNSIWGVLSPYAKSLPDEPYFQVSEIFHKHIKSPLL